MCFLPAQHRCRGRPGTVTWAGLTPQLHLLTGTVLPLWHCLVVLFRFFFFFLSFSPVSNLIPQGLSWSHSAQAHPCTRTCDYSLSRPWTSFQTTLLKWEGPGKFSHLPSSRDTSLWKSPQLGALGSGRKGELGELDLIPKPLGYQLGFFFFFEWVSESDSQGSENLNLE